MKFAKYVFGIAGIYGILVLAPMFFLLEKTGRDYPPAITHPEYYYGFVGLALAFQLAFLTIAIDPIRFRPIMIAAIVEKFSFAIAVAVLFAQSRIQGPILIGAAIDLLLSILFLVSYFVTPSWEHAGE